jgi:H+/Cl- antiporter ClcA
MVARKLSLLEDETRTLIACGAGAGLAAVYNVPLAGALFSLEVMLLSFSWEKRWRR